MVVRPGAGNVSLESGECETGPKEEWPLPVPVGQLLEGLPGVLIVADQLGHHHDLVPVVVDGHSTHGVLCEFLKCVLHDLNSHVVELDGIEVGGLAYLLLQDHRRMLLVEYLCQSYGAVFLLDEAHPTRSYIIIMWSLMLLIIAPIDVRIGVQQYNNKWMQECTWWSLSLPPQA